MLRRPYFFSMPLPGIHSWEEAIRFGKPCHVWLSLKADSVEEGVGVKRLQQLLQRIDGKGYKAYKEIEGEYRDGEVRLCIDHVQGDPFASPSRIRLRVPQSSAGFPARWWNEVHRRVALENAVARRASSCIQEAGVSSMGSGNSGLLFVDASHQVVLPRTAVVVTAEYVELRMSVGLPARGRRILGQQAHKLLCQRVPQMARRCLFASSYDRDMMEAHLRLADDQERIRQYLRERGGVAFVANGSVLPRQSGASQQPQKGPGTVAFQSPPELEQTIHLPGGRKISGMLIPAGVTLIVGGGFHGKSTLLQALQRGVYNHVLGDGREYVITDERAVKVRAEDGRSIQGVDISPFINRLPQNQDTRFFSTADASGSTSQAANIMEALEAGAKVLLIDEDTSATNFMIRDARMQELVSPEEEPITPFLDRVRQLFSEHGVSTILVMGGSGDYFDVADTVIRMKEYLPQDVTQEAREIARQYQTLRREEGGERFGPIGQRAVLPQAFRMAGGRGKAEGKGLRTILYGKEAIDLQLVEQLVDPSQTRAIARMLLYLQQRVWDGKVSIREGLKRLYQALEKEGLDLLSPYPGQHPGDLALPRELEVAAAINRYRRLQTAQIRDDN